MKKSKDGTPVKEIVAEWLRANHYDGLCNPDGECGCGLDDLMSCQCIDERNCVCAYEIPVYDGCEYDRMFSTSNSDQDEPSDTLEKIARDMYREIEEHDAKHPDEVPRADDTHRLYGDRLHKLGVIL